MKSKIIFVLLLILASSCEQHYYFLKKIKVDKETSKLKPDKKVDSILANSINEENISVAFSSNILLFSPKNYPDFNDSVNLIPNSKSISIPKKGEQTISNQIVNPRHYYSEKHFPLKLIFGILLIIIGLFMLSIVQGWFKTLAFPDGGCIGGCIGILLLMILPFALGLGLTIAGIVELLTN